MSEHGLDGYDARERGRVGESRGYEKVSFRGSGGGDSEQDEATRVRIPSGVRRLVAANLVFPIQGSAFAV